MVPRRDNQTLIAVRVQHHPSRDHLIPPLLDQLGGFEDLEVVPDPAPEDTMDAWRAHRACLETISSGVAHLLVLQDDVLPQHDFAERVHNAIAAKPESVLLGFVPGFPRERRIQMLAHKRKIELAPFIVGAYVPTVAIVYPREVVEGMLAWADKKGGDRYRRPLRGADDGIVAHYCRTHRLHPLAMVPCAVEHDESVASIGKPRRHGPHRRAALL